MRSSRKPVPFGKVKRLIEALSAVLFKTLNRCRDIWMLTLVLSPRYNMNGSMA